MIIDSLTHWLVIIGIDIDYWLVNLMTQWFTQLSQLTIDYCNCNSLNIIIIQWLNELSPKLWLYW